MASPTMCPRCLRRSLCIDRSLTNSISRTPSATFSTTSPLLRQPPPKKAAPRGSLQTKAVQASWQKKKGGPVAVTTRTVSPAERKALRNRVVLSNTNALPVHGLRTLDATNVDALRAVEGNVVGLGTETVDVLRALEAFKPTQGWSMFQRPATVVRPETVRLAGLVKRAGRDGTAAEKSSRVVLHGEQGSGKSVLQLQVMAAAQLKGWILVHIPDAKYLADGETIFSPSTSTDGRTTYIQPEYTSDLLARILKANEKILSKMQLAHKHKFVIPVQSNISLSRLVEIGARDQELAYPIWKAFVQEITTKSQEGNGLQRPSVLFTIDGFGHVMGESQYVDQKLKKIHTHDLALVSDFCALLNGRFKMENGGIVLASTSESNRPATPSLDFLLAKEAAKEQGSIVPHWNPYIELDSKVQDALRDVELVKVGGISRNEAKGLMEYYALSGLLRENISDALVGEKWAVSGGGIIGAIERGCVLQRI